jgi:hypothetical protein
VVCGGTFMAAGYGREVTPRGAMKGKEAMGWSDV